MTRKELEKIIKAYITKHRLEGSWRLPMAMQALHLQIKTPAEDKDGFDPTKIKLPVHSKCTEKQFFEDYWEEWEFFKQNCPSVWKRWNAQENRMRITVDSLHEAFTLLTKTVIDRDTFETEIERFFIEIKYATISNRRTKCVEVDWYIHPKPREITMLKERGAKDPEMAEYWNNRILELQDLIRD